MVSSDDDSRSPRCLLRRLWRGVRIAAVLYLSILLLMLLFENKIVYPALRYPGGDWNATATLGLQDIEFDSSDGTHLHGLLAEHDDPAGYLLFCHGNAGNVTGRAGRIAQLRDRFRLTAFVFDYRGYGRSDGSPNEEGVLADAHAARAWFARHVGVPSNDILLLGRSLGGGVAVDLAARGGAKGLILESTFTTMPDVGAAAYPWLPVRSLMKNRYDSLSKIAQIDCPLLMSHGTNDSVIPIALGRRLFAAAIVEKTFVIIEGGGHNGPQSNEFFDALEAFLDRVLGPRKGS